jgi:transcriptional regulator with XRE-family HTH domain
MTVAYSTEVTRDFWREVEADTDAGQRMRATGAEIAGRDSVPWAVDLDLSAGLWTVRYERHGASYSVAQLVEHIEALVAQRGGGAAAFRLAMLWNSTAYGLKFDANFPSDQTQVAPVGIAGTTETAEPPHVRLARELRELTGLSAASIGAALGVTREQYQRWLAGGAISDTRHGQLIYLHTISVDVIRRLGPEKARLWWKTPVDADATPEDLLKRRRADQVYRLVAAIPDPAPVVDGVLHGLLIQDNVEFDEDDDNAGEA